MKSASYAIIAPPNRSFDAIARCSIGDIKARWGTTPIAGNPMSTSEDNSEEREEPERRNPLELMRERHPDLFSDSNALRLSWSSKP
jgi:hypothetical protein